MNIQALVQQFTNNLNLENTPPDKTQDVLQYIRNFYDQVSSDQQAISFSMFKVADYIMRLKAVSQDIRALVEQCIFDIINKSLSHEFRVGSQALKVIFDTACEYYKHNNLDPTLRYPLGINRQLNWYEPEAGQSIDVVKPYISSTNYCGWSRGILLEKENKKYVLKYDNTENTTTVKDPPFFDKLGQRTKDHDWRMSLDIGSQVDAFNRVWFASTVVELKVENGSKIARITFRRFNENGSKQDSEGQKYDGLGPNEDNWYDILSSRIQKPGKMAKQLCYYSYTSEEIQIDDSYDLIFEKQYEQEPFWAIMRLNYTRSTTYLHFFECLVSQGGYEKFINLIKSKDTPIDTVINMMIIFGFTSFLVPRMGLNRYLPQLLELGVAYIKQNFANFNNWRLDVFSGFISFIANRLYSLSQRHKILNDLRKFLALQYLKLNLEKNLVAIKFLFELIKPLRPYQTEEERKELQNFFVENQIFYKLIQNNVHESVLARSVDILKFLMDSQLIGWNEIEHIWNVIPHNDLRGRATIEKLLADTSKNFKIEYTQKLIDILLNIKQTQLTIDKLNLLRVLKNYEISIQYKSKILYYLWEHLTVKSTNIKQSIEEEVESVYRGFIATIKQNELRLSVIHAMRNRLKDITNVRNEMRLFREFILTYPNKIDPNAIKEQGDFPHTIKEVIDYLKTQNIYDDILRLLAAAKTKEKIQTTLEFLQFLFNYDSSDIGHTIKQTFQILGPSDSFLIWAKHFTYRATNFFIDMYQNPQNMKKFEKVSSTGIDSIKTILLDINFYKGNIKILKKRKVQVVVQGPVNAQGQGPVSTGTGTQPTGPYSTLNNAPQANQGQEQKGETLTFIYVLKSPFECIGLSFLLELLQYISSNSVYNDVIKLIIQFIVNLDDSIAHKTQIYRSEFLERIMKNILSIAQANVYNDAVKLQLQTYLNLLQQLFSETQKEGLGSISPHFCSVEGEVLRLKFQNLIPNSDIHKKEPFILEINENQTLWKLKQCLSEQFKVSPNKIDVIKYVNPIEDVNLGKSLSSLFFFNQEGVKIQKKQAKDLPRFELLNDDNETMTEKFEKIVDKWFNQYKNEKQIMGIEEMLKLGSENWKGSLMKEKDKLLNIIEKHDKDKKGGLFHSEFKEYFIKAAYEQNAMVWRLINLSGYKNNLRHTSEPENQMTQNSMPRKLLSHQFVYETIFTILSNTAFQPMHLDFYRFLGMLQTDNQLCNFIKNNIKEFFQSENSSIYKFCYGIEILIVELDKNMELFEQFYQHKGHMQIVNKLNSFFTTNQSVYKFQQFSKVVIIPILLKILNLFVYPLISENKYIRFLKKIKINQLDTTDIIKKIEKEENFTQGQQVEKRNILIKGTQLNLDELYKICFNIFDNLISNYQKEILVRLTNEIARLYGFLAVIYPNFNPEDLFKGCNSESLNIRRSCHSLIYIYYLQNPSQKFILLEKLLISAPSEMKPISNTYYDLVAILLEKILQEQAKNEESEPFFKKVGLHLIQKFLKCPNQHRGHILPNKVLGGLLNALLILLQKMPKITAQLSQNREVLIKKGLFMFGVRDKINELTVDSELLVSHTQLMHFEDYVKCKTEQNRKLLMEVIYLLYKESKEDHSKFFDTFILPIFNEIIDPTKRNGQRVMHVGLINLGSTCYMNSMLQVLNSIDVFRNAIIMANADIPLIHELKSLFSYLFFSERVAYDTKALLNAFIPPINPGIQQDTTQFLNLLFDQVQECLKKSPYKKILPELFQGNTVAQMICHNCGAKRERTEYFFTYSVEIDGKYDLHSALEGMHGGQLINDCLCQSCNTRSDTTKRNVLNVVPNFFFVHLKRIVFNYDVFMNTKIHTRLYFPDQLNFQPYTKEGLELRQNLGVEYIKSLKDNEEEMKKFEELTLHGHSKDYYQMKLKGIIVHSGTPDIGHYYAILKKNGNWIKFDDSRVTTFGMSGFEDECYGGNWTPDEWGGSGSSKNAYVLVYEKESKKDIQLLVEKQEDIVEKQVVPYPEFSKTFNTVQWYKDVWLDNHSLMLEQQLISESYTKQFLKFICAMLDLISSDATIELISEITFKISALSGQIGTLPEIFEKNLHRIKIQYLKNYILADGKRTFNLLFHNQAKVRDFAALYIERILMHAYTQGTEEDKNDVMKFIQQYLGYLHNDAAKNWLRIDGYFKMFQRLVETSFTVEACYPLYQFFINADIITYFIDFVLEKASPLTLIQKKYSLGTKSNPLNFNAGVAIAFKLIRHSFNMTGNNYQVPQIDAKYLFHLSDNAILVLNSPVFYEKMIKENQNPHYLCLLIERLCIQNLPFSEAIARVLLKVVNQNTQLSAELETVLMCVGRFMRITDQFWIKRAEALLGTPSPFIYQQNILSSLDEEKYVYPSTLQNIFPLESLLNYAHINRIRVPLTVLNILKTILEGTSVSETAMEFMITLPSPCYNNLRYVDWIRPFVNNVINHLNISDKKKEQVVSKISLCNMYLDDLQKIKKDMKYLVLGEVQKKELIETIANPEGDALVNIYNVPVYVAESVPNGGGNTTFDQYLTNGRLQKAVTLESNILRFFKQCNKPLAIKAKPVEEDEDKELNSLFDEDPYPHISTSTGTGPEIQAQPEPKKEEAPAMEVQPQAEKKQQKDSDAKVQEEEVIREQINVEGVTLSKDYLRCIEFVNKSEGSKVILLDIKKNEDSNCNLPTMLKFTVSKSTEEFFYTKTDHTKAWGDVEKQLYVFNNMENPKPFIRLYQRPVLENLIQAEQAQNMESLLEKDAKMEVEEKKEETPADEMVAEDGMINCPICTFVNPSSNDNCEICESPLH